MNNGPPSGRVQIQDTPPPPRKVLSRPVVRVILPEPGSKDGAARIYSEDRKVEMTSATGMVSKRFPQGQRSGYFKSELYEDGILEIGDRVPQPDPAW